MYRDANRRSAIFTLFGRNPKTRLIDLFLTNSLFEFTPTEIVKDLGMAKVTLYPLLDELVEQDIIEITRKIGKSNLYCLKRESSTVQLIIALVRDHSRKTAEKEHSEAPKITITETASKN